MADRPAGQGFGVVGAGAAACAVCCAGPVIGFVAAASVGTLIGIALFGVAGLAVAVIALVAYLHRRQQRLACPPEDVSITLGRKADA